LPCDEQVTVETSQPQYEIIKPRPIPADIQLYNIPRLFIPKHSLKPKSAWNRQTLRAQVVLHESVFEQIRAKGDS
ncbi:hypothetical protein, partial [Bifidobacterium aquikefiri]|uniref:hypothetical protein n=1 Tax=Bifidobacterium aquikefiri TaxID=1653207 RepID=UPI0039E767D6